MEKVSSNNSLSFVIIVKAQETIIHSKYSVSEKPLDFSFLKLQDIQQLKKEQARDGKRKPIQESDEEEDMKKVSYTF